MSLTAGRIACKECSYLICVCKPVVGYNTQSKNCVEDKSSTPVVSNKTEDRVICIMCCKLSINHSKKDDEFCDNELKLCQEQMLNDGLSLSFNIKIINGHRVKIPRLMSTQKAERIKEGLNDELLEY